MKLLKFVARVDFVFSIISVIYYLHIDGTGFTNDGWAMFSAVSASICTAVIFL